MGPEKSLLPPTSNSNSWQSLLIAAAAAFCAYFCIYAFRKPFTAATFEGPQAWGMDLKVIFVISQLLGYTVSKFIGIKVVSEMPAQRRAWGTIALVVISEIALVGFAFAPLVVKVAMIFVNGLVLGMTFGLILAFLEGRKQTEALSAALCASFIVSSGVVKSIGRWLVQDLGVSEYQMPMLTGLIFFAPLLVALWVLQSTPPPDNEDRNLRTERKAMSRRERQQFMRTYWPGLSLLIYVYFSLTVVRTLRDDFGVEIWRDMGVTQTPSVFATSETVVAVLVTACSGLVIWVRNNILALRITVASMIVAFLLVAGSAVGERTGILSPFAFMVACGIGLYVPYVAFHTTVFERLIAASRLPSNLGFLMYLADSLGYLGYAIIIISKTRWSTQVEMLPFFRWTLLIAAVTSIVSLVAAMIYFHRALVSPKSSVAAEGGDVLTSMATLERRP